MPEPMPVNYICRGKPLSDAERESLRRSKALDQAVAERLAQLGITRKAKGPAEIPERESCGRDLTELIQQVPEDGEDYEVACPCGKITFSVMRTTPGKG